VYRSFSSILTTGDRGSGPMAGSCLTETRMIAERRIQESRSSLRIAEERGVDTFRVVDE